MLTIELTEVFDPKSVDPGKVYDRFGIVSIELEPAGLRAFTTAAYGYVENDLFVPGHGHPPFSHAIPESVVLDMRNVQSSAAGETHLDEALRPLLQWFIDTVPEAAGTLP